MNKIIASAALTASMVGGGVVGAAVLSGTALAQDDAPSDDPTTESESPRERRHAHLEELAEVLNTDADTLRDALRNGETLAGVAESQGVAAQTVVDAIIAQFEARVADAVAEGRITAEEAAEKQSGFEERANDIVDGEAPLGRGGHRGGPRGANLDELAATLDTDAESLRAALQDGQSIADVAEANGVDIQEVIDEMIAQAEERLDAAVADGRITAEEAADKSADIAERATDVANGDAPVRGPRGPRGPHGPGDDGPPADAPEVQGSAVGGA